MKTVEVDSIINGVDLDVLTETVAAVQDDPGLGLAKFRVSNDWVQGTHNVSTISGYYGARQEMTHKQDFQLHADEPPILAGGDEAANPVEILLGSLASCLTTSLVAHAAVNGIEVRAIRSSIEGDLDLNGFLGLNPDTPKGFTDIRVSISVDASEADTQKLKSLALYSPVFSTLTNGVNVSLEVVR